MITIFALNIVAFLFMVGVNFPSSIFSAYLKSLGGTEIIISIGAAALYITRGTASILVDKLAKKLSFKNLFIVAFFGSAISSLIFLIPNSPLTVAGLRTIQGIFSGFYWVLINIYAVSLASTSIEKLKNLSSVTIFLNLGGFLGSILSGLIASHLSADLCFYIGTAILLAGIIPCKNLNDICCADKKEKVHSKISHLASREKLIIGLSTLFSSINTYVGIAVPIFILQLGGSYFEMGMVTALSILAVAIVNSIAPFLRKHFCYRTLMKADYVLILICLFSIFYFKNIVLIYFLQSSIIGIAALERNMWYSILNEHSSNYNKSMGLLRGYIDYFGVILFLTFGFAIKYFGSVNVAIVMGICAFIYLLIISFYHKLNFLKHKESVHIKGLTGYIHVLHKLE